MKAKTLLAAAFATGASLVALAATPYAVWDGASPEFDFSVLTRRGYTLGNIGGSYMNTVAADATYLQIGNNNAKEGITLKKADGTNMGASTVIFKVENITAADGFNRAMAAFLASGTYNGSHALIGIARSKDVSFTVTTGEGDDAVTETVSMTSPGAYIWQGAVWNADNPAYFSDGAFAPSESARTIALGYSYAGGTSYYVDGVLKGAQSGLRSSGYNPAGIVLGGVDTTGNSKFYPMVGMKITAIAFFGEKLSDEDVAAYKFPSDAGVLTMTQLNALTAEGGEGTDDVDKSFTSVITADVAPTAESIAFLQNSAWRGVVRIDGLELDDNTLADFGNANSTIRLAGEGVTIGTLADNVTFAGALTGDGSLNVTATPDPQKSLNLTGDCTTFSGDVTIAAGGKARIVFGSQNIAGNNNCISVGSDATVTIASGKTWTAPAGFVIQGNATVNGTLSGTVYGQTGVVTVTKNQACTVASSWTGTVKVAYNPGNVRIKLADYGSNADATIEIAGANGVFEAFPSTTWDSGGTAPAVGAKVTLSANWTIANGWDDATTTFAKLTGSGNLTVNGTTSGNTKIRYAITTLEEYTGTLGGVRSQFKIGNIVKDGAQVGGLLVNVAADATFIDLDATTVNGETANVEMQTVSDVAGLYWIEKTDEAITVEGGTVSLAADGTITATFTEAVESADDVVVKVSGSEKSFGNGYGFAVTLAEGGMSATIAPAVTFAEATTQGTAAWTEGENDVTLNVDVVPGMYYAAASGSSLTIARPAATTPATAETVITAPKQTGEQGFYQVWVSVMPISAETTTSSQE